MSLRVNSTGYISSMGKLDSYKNGAKEGVYVRFVFQTEREHYGKYDNKYNAEEKFDVINCVAFDKKAEYIYNSYHKVVEKTKNSDVKVDIYGHIEVDVKETKGIDLKFISRMPGEPEEYGVKLKLDSDLFYKNTFVSIKISEITFIELEKNKHTSPKGNSLIRNTTYERTTQSPKNDTNEKDIDDAINEIHATAGN